jgi:hypothetical protein
VLGATAREEWDPPVEASIVELAAHEPAMVPGAGGLAGGEGDGGPITASHRWGGGPVCLFWLWGRAGLAAPQRVPGISLIEG